MLVVPPEGEGLTVIASVSGGKDSTALLLALREAEIPFRAVFANTVWEAIETYAYLEFLRRTLQITIDVVGVDGGMEARCRHRAGFPGRMQRFCTRELKIEPLREYHDQSEVETGLETISAMGVRADESEARSKMAEWVDEGPKFTRDRWGGFVWRPLIRWTIADVLAIHARHGIPVHPLYQRGHNRVGCFPCIFSGKEEIALIAKHAPEQIDKIRGLEGELTQLRLARNVEKPGRYKHPDDATFFQTQRQGFSGIDKVVTWARTEHGGRQLPLLAEPPKGGCMSWGACDIAPTSDLDGVSSVAMDAMLEGRFKEAMALNREVIETIIAEMKAQP